MSFRRAVCYQSQHDAHWSRLPDNYQGQGCNELLAAVMKDKIKHRTARRHALARIHLPSQGMCGMVIPWMTVAASVALERYPLLRTHCHEYWRVVFKDLPAARLARSSSTSTRASTPPYECCRARPQSGAEAESRMDLHWGVGER